MNGLPDKIRESVGTVVEKKTSLDDVCPNYLRNVISFLQLAFSTGRSSDGDKLTVFNKNEIRFTSDGHNFSENDNIKVVKNRKYIVIK